MTTILFISLYQAGCMSAYEGLKLIRKVVQKVIFSLDSHQSPTTPALENMAKADASNCLPSSLVSLPTRALIEKSYPTNSRGSVVFSRTYGAMRLPQRIKESRYHGHTRNGFRSAGPFATVAIVQDTCLGLTLLHMTHKAQVFLKRRQPLRIPY